MKKIISLVLALLIVFSFVMTGCQSGETEEGGIYTIDWYLVTGTMHTNVDDVEAKVNEYIQDKIGAKLKMHYLTWSQYDEKLNVMNAGGEKYDICWTSGDTYRLNAAKNAYLPINELMDKYAPKTKELIGEDFLKAAQIDGKNYGIPANKDKGQSYGILYRKDLAEKYGFTEKLNNLKCFDELYPMLDVIKEKEPDIEPLQEHGPSSYKDFYPFDIFAFPAGVYLTDTDTVVNYVESPQYREACKKSRENLVNGYSWLENAPNEGSFIEISSLNSGKAKELNVTRKYEREQVELTERYMTTTSATGSIMAISRTSKNPEKAMQFLELLNTDPYLNNLIIFGIENVNYKKVDENTIELIKNSGYGNAGMQWEFGNTFINYTVKGEDPEKAEKLKAFNDSLVPVGDLGFVFNHENVKTEVGACQNVRKEFETRLANGEEDVDKLLDEYISKLKAAGSDIIVKEVSKQYKEWKKK